MISQAQYMSLIMEYMQKYLCYNHNTLLELQHVAKLLSSVFCEVFSFNLD